MFCLQKSRSKQIKLCFITHRKFCVDRFSNYESRLRNRDPKSICYTCRPYWFIQLYGCLNNRISNVFLRFKLGEKSLLCNPTLGSLQSVKSLYKNNHHFRDIQGQHLLVINIIVFQFNNIIYRFFLLLSYNIKANVPLNYQL